MLVREEKSNRIGIIFSVLLLLLVSVGIGVFLIANPKQSDDFWFGQDLKFWFEENGLPGVDCGWEALRNGFPHRVIFDCWINHMGFDCGRIANPVMLYFLVLPKWVGSTVALLSWIACMVFSFRLAGITMRREWIVAVGVFCWSFQIAWSEWMGGLAYQFNYVVGSGLMVWYIWWCSQKKSGLWGLILLFIAGIMVGAWHEGFSIPVVAGGFAVLVFYKDFRHRQYFVALGGIAVGLAFLLLCPGFINRLNNEVGEKGWPLLLAATVFMCNFTYFIVLFITVGRLLMGKRRGISPLVVFALVSGALSVYMQYSAGAYRRISWWADIISIIALMEILGSVKIYPGYSKKNVLRWGVYVVLGGLAVAHWVYVDYFTVKASVEFRKLLADYHKGDKRQVFHDFTPAMQLPFICTWTPDMQMFTNGWGVATMNGYFFGSDGDKYISVFPKSLKFVTAGSGERMPGNTQLRVIDRKLFSEPSAIIFEKGAWTDRIMADLTMSTGIRAECVMSIKPFVSEADGREYFYIRPTDINMKVLVGSIEKVENLRPCWMPAGI